jgi:hypothetical protein
MKRKYVKSSVVKFSAAVCLFLTALLLIALSKGNPDAVSGVFKSVSRNILFVFGRVYGLFPFSIAEIFLYLLVTGVITYVILCVVRVIRKKSGPSIFLKCFTDILITASALFFLFNVLWGLNYYSLPLSEELGLDVREYSVIALSLTTKSMADNLNAISDSVNRDENGVCELGEFADLAAMAKDSFDSISSGVAFFNNFSAGRAKYVAASEVMSYCGISGIFIPFTGEANVNKNIPDSSKPFTISHELAHSAGIAPENEANFAAFLVCRDSPYAEFNYSGYLNAFIYCYNALVSEDRDAAYELWRSLDSNVIADIAERSSYWGKYEGKAREVSNSLNDSYLKTMSQSDGVKSYGMVVDLLIADYVNTYGNPDGV